MVALADAPSATAQQSAALATAKLDATPRAPAVNEADPLPDGSTESMSLYFKNTRFWL
jgi:hypothetical protein